MKTRYELIIEGTDADQEDIIQIFHLFTREISMKYSGLEKCDFKVNGESYSGFGEEISE
ncbi:hypothetical protein MmiAt1_00770 [Methanimicrococcus sp. At1]|uniref:Uncharacterized protein n=1 Tax=Methanimicrococcus hacksteinii TaxID=3028293 RepID=A0ABU3VNQ6_9EURY|nr:hypothetical protein [Methanimicrococcus sp. At1]MDV0444550.1 hypothetical protein [Methanimicrococcus sp. At1]